MSLGQYDEGPFKNSNNSLQYSYPCLTMKIQAYLPLHIVHSTSDCEDWSSSAPPDKKQLSHSYINDKESSSEGHSCGYAVAHIWKTEYPQLCPSHHIHSININTAKGIFHFLGYRTQFFSCKNFQNVWFICRITVKDTQSRQLLKLRLVVRWIFSHWGHRRSNTSVCVCVFSL